MPAHLVALFNNAVSGSFLVYSLSFGRAVYLPKLTFYEWYRQSQNWVGNCGCVTGLRDPSSTDKIIAFNELVVACDAWT